MQAVIILIIILAVLLVVFTLQNQMEITINLFFWELADIPLVLVLIGSLILGYILAAIYFYPRMWKIKKEYNKLIRFNKELKELHEIEHAQDVEEIVDPEGIPFDDDEEDKSFFKD